MLTLVQIYQAIKEIADLALTAKDLPDLVNQIQGFNAEDMYMRASEDVLNQEKEVFLGKGVNFDYDIRILKKKIQQNGVDFNHLAVSPEILNEKICKQVAMWILANDFLFGVDIGVEVNSGWAEQIARAINERYAKLLFDKLFNDAVRQELQFIAENVKDNRKIQEDVEQLLTISRNITTRLATDYTSLTTKSTQEIFGVSAYLVEHNKIKPATQERLKSFYQGDLLWWDIIAANGDVERDKQNQILKSYRFYPKAVKMLCIAGEPGAGKSTLAWRIAWNISRNLGFPLIQLRDNESEDFWYLLENGVGQRDSPVIILIDDVFRNANITRALASINPDIPVMIISTSRSNEIPRLLIHFSIDYIFLKHPSKKEIYRVVNRTKPQNIIDHNQINQLGTSTSWLVLMYEITTGEKLSVRIGDSVKRLKTQDETVYRAYEYICFGGLYELPFPETLLLNLDEKGAFYNIDERPSSRGIIFPTVKEGFLRTTHPLISEAALKVYGRDPIAVLGELLAATNPEELSHRDFVFKLLNNLSKDTLKERINSLLNNWSTKIESILQNASISELSISMIHFFKGIGDKEKISQIETLIATKPPESASDWVIVTDLAINTNSKEDGRKRIEQMELWLISNDNSYVRSLYLRLVDKYGSQGQTKRAMSNSLEWIKKNPSAKNVHARLFALIAKHGKRNQINELIEETILLFKSDPKSFILSVNILSLINKRGSISQIRKVVRLSLIWLGYHPNNAEVRKTVIGIIKERDDIVPANEIIKDTFNWLKDNSENTSVRPALLSLITYKGTLDEVEFAKEETQAFLKKYPQKVDVLIGYYELIEIRGSMDEKRALVQDGIDWIKQYPKSTKMRVRVMQLAKRLATKEQLRFLIDFNRDWETKINNPTFSSVYKSLIQEYNRTRKQN